MDGIAGGPHHRVPAGPVVELGPVVRMVRATGGRPADLRTDRLPVTTTSLWTRSDRPDADEVPLQLHFDVKARLGFEHAVITRHRTAVRRPTRVGDRIGHHQQLRSLGPSRMTPLGPGRDWEVDHVLTDADGEVLSIETFGAVGYVPTPRSVRPEDLAPAVEPWTTSGIARAAAACRVWAPAHHDPEAARRAGLPGVIACTQHLAAMAEHEARSAAPAGEAVVVARLDLRMRRPVVAGPAPIVSVRPGRTRGEVVVRWEQRSEVTTVARVLLASA
ncbi:MaoC family dehydratase [Dermatobacter hominis]|uniref:MaoC family dehydratase n=1 Tax=Dermatobacter hominis TaxID=2884263 RepID=UPI001D104DF3|nr:MaoC family dehydratase [Dermatobacter hominis]UDY37838.1 MaoC family dehydratase [Dermatobacter hominis]